MSTSTPPAPRSRCRVSSIPGRSAIACCSWRARLPASRRWSITCASAERVDATVKVLLVVIDAATPHVVCPAIKIGRLPVLQQLADAGAMHEASASIFPSITPAATTSIITGAYPAEHGIAGASWYDEQRAEVAYYGDDFWVIAREGFGHFINDFLLRLNGDRLRAPTLFEMVERAGRSAACLNYLVFRGNVPHRVRMPGVMAALPGVPLTETV